MAKIRIWEMEIWAEKKGMTVPLITSGADFVSLPQTNIATFCSTTDKPNVHTIGATSGALRSGLKTSRSTRMPTMADAIMAIKRDGKTDKWKTVMSAKPKNAPSIYTSP